MKKVYQSPVVIVHNVKTTDIICTSAGSETDVMHGKEAFGKEDFGEE